MNTTTVEIAGFSIGIHDSAPRHRVSLTAPPKGVHIGWTARPDTAPSPRAIRCDGMPDPLNFDPVLRHANTRKDRG